MWTEFQVQLRFVTKLCGGVPTDPKMIEAWLEARKPTIKPPSGKSIDEITQEVMATTPQQLADEAPPISPHVFQRHPKTQVLVVGMRTIRGHIKDICQTLSSLYVAKIEGERSFAVKGKNGIYYPPELYWIPVLHQKTRKPFTAADGVYDKAIHIATPRGPRSALKSLEYVHNALLEFPLLVLTQPPSPGHPKGRLVVSAKDIETIFRYGGTHGYGPERGDGEGRYLFTIKQGKEID